MRLVERASRVGAAWAITINFPATRKTVDMIKNREALASALTVDEVQLLVECVRGNGRHAGRVTMWVADAVPRQIHDDTKPASTPHPATHLRQPLPRADRDHLDNVRCVCSRCHERRPRIYARSYDERYRFGRLRTVLPPTLSPNVSSGAIAIEFV